MANQPNNQMQFTSPKPRTPANIAAAIGVYVMSFVRIVFWILVAAATCAAGYVAIRALLWAVALCLRALGAE